MLGVTDFGTTDDNVMPVTVERRTSAPLTSDGPKVLDGGEPRPTSTRRVIASTLPKPSKDFAEREQREAANTGTEAERWLGDPPPDRSALAAKR